MPSGANNYHSIIETLIVIFAGTWAIAFSVFINEESFMISNYLYTYDFCTSYNALLFGLFLSILGIKLYVLQEIKNEDISKIVYLIIALTVAESFFISCVSFLRISSAKNILIGCCVVFVVIEIVALITFTERTKKREWALLFFLIASLGVFGLVADKYHDGRKRNLENINFHRCSINYITDNIFKLSIFGRLPNSSEDDYKFTLINNNHLKIHCGTKNPINPIHIDKKCCNVKVSWDVELINVPKNGFSFIVCIDKNDFSSIRYEWEIERGKTPYEYEVKGQKKRLKI